MILLLRAQQVLLAMIWYVIPAITERMSVGLLHMLQTPYSFRDHRLNCSPLYSFTGKRLSWDPYVKPYRRASLKEYLASGRVGQNAGCLELMDNCRVIAHIREVSSFSRYTSLPTTPSSLRRSTSLHASTTQTSTPTVAYALTFCETSGAQP